MTQVYSDQTREDDPYALPDVEVFYISEREANYTADGNMVSEPGWYWWTCFPGCMPDSEPFGPFDTEDEATEDAQDIEGA